jgi:hypothetical protein
MLNYSVCSIKTQIIQTVEFISPGVMVICCNISVADKEASRPLNVIGIGVGVTLIILTLASCVFIVYYYRKYVYVIIWLLQMSRSPVRLTQCKRMNYGNVISTFVRMQDLKQVSQLPHCQFYYVLMF